MAFIIIPIIRQCAFRIYIIMYILNYLITLYLYLYFKNGLMV